MITNHNRPSLLVVSAMQIKAFMLLYKIIENIIIRANSVKCLSRRVGDDASPKPRLQYSETKSVINSFIGYPPLLMLQHPSML
jgi:hypothetical protein